MRVYEIKVRGKAPGGLGYVDEYEAQAEDMASARDEAKRLLGRGETLVSVTYLREAE